MTTFYHMGNVISDAFIYQNSHFLVFIFSITNMLILL